MSAIIELDRKEHLCKWMVSIQGREISVSLIDSLSPAPPPPQVPKSVLEGSPTLRNNWGGGTLQQQGVARNLAMLHLLVIRFYLYQAYQIFKSSGMLERRLKTRTIPVNPGHLVSLCGTMSG